MAKKSSIFSTFASAMMVRDLAVVEKELGFSYEMNHPSADHYQRVCPRCRRALFGLAQGALWSAHRTRESADESTA